MNEKVKHLKEVIDSSCKLEESVDIHLHNFQDGLEALDFISNLASDLNILYKEVIHAIHGFGCYYISEEFFSVKAYYKI